MKRLALATTLLLTAALSACGYFNSYYNAQRSFAEAERAQARGELAIAANAYRTAIEKAAVTFREHRESRWGDDALLLIGRARFRVGEHAAARAALSRVLEESRDDDVRALAAIYLGATLVELAVPGEAVPHLVSGLERVDRDSEHAAFAHLWLGRARLATGDTQGWADLELTSRRADLLGLDATLELAARALQQRDSLRAGRSLQQLASLRSGGSAADSTLALIASATQHWGSAAVARWVPADAGSGWEIDPRTRIRVRRAQLLAAAGDTTLALREVGSAVQIATGAAAAEGRLTAARWLLAQLPRADELPQVRSMLLPAVDDAAVNDLLRRIRIVEALLDRARDGQATALFAAAELARDTLAAPRVARELFLTYADVAETTVWAPKALLAALALSHGAEREPILPRIEHARDNPYVASLRGNTDAEAFASAEERLGRAVTAVTADARARALASDIRVSGAAMRLDSLRNLARGDSLRSRCGGMIDSLAIGGIRSDSVRAACMRSDSVNVTRYLGIDTVLLRTGVPPDTSRRPGRGRDTMIP